MLKVELEMNQLAFERQSSLIAHSDSKMEATILCFTQPPRPPKLNPCSECGTFEITSGERFYFNPNPRVFEDRGGFLELKIQNKIGEVWQQRIRIDPPLNQL